nr:aminotransferase class V-fold PLP-dependent enzyme [uncultured Faecalimonas sp.]
METLYNRLERYGDSDFYGMHMPGHKRNRGLIRNRIPYELDITEIDGFDDLHHAEGILKEAEARAARLYKADRTHFLVNGSTVGILSAILGSTKKGDKILVARNCHKSVYHGIYLNELEPVYIYPAYEKSGINGEISPDEVEKILERERGIRAVMIVSPTYDGVVSDVREIARIVHRYGIPLIVDEAHGAHFGFHPYFPENANTKGADVVIHSVHKTLPALTQTALIHLNGTIADRKKIERYLHMLQSSSPSYLLMASIDVCMEFLEKRGQQEFETYVQELEKVRQRLENLKMLKLIRTKQYDRSKLVISVKESQISSRELSQILREKYHLEMEMTAGDYILAMTSVGDTKEGLERFAAALEAIDAGLKGADMQAKSIGSLPRTELCLKSSEIIDREDGVSVAWKESSGFISMEYAYLYPPGIPLIVPGEKMTEEVISCLEEYQKRGFSIEGLKEEGKIKVCRDE